MYAGIYNKYMYLYIVLEAQMIVHMVLVTPRL